MSKRNIWVAALCALLIQPVQAQTSPEARPHVSVQFTAVPFRDALQMLFKNSGLQYSIDPNVPNALVTLNLRDLSIDQALRLIIRASGVPDLVSRRDGDVYVIRIAPPGPAHTELTLEKIPVQFQRVDQVLRELRNSNALQGRTGEPGQGTDLMPEGVVSIHPSSSDNSLLVRGTPEGLTALKNLMRLIDIPERTLVLTVGVTGPGAASRELRIQSSARTLNGRNVTIDEEVPVGSQRSKLKVQLEPFLRGDGTIHVDADWDVSVSVPGAKGEAIRLVKRFQSSTALQSGLGVAVATVDLSSWGGKGQVRFWLRGQSITGQNRSVEGPAGEKLRDTVRLLGDVPYLPVGLLAPNWEAEVVRMTQGYELVSREKPLPEGIIAAANRPKAAGAFFLFVKGDLVSERMLFAGLEDGELVSDPNGEPYLPLVDVARALGGKLTFDPLTDTYRIVGGRSFGSLLGGAAAGR